MTGDRGYGIPIDRGAQREDDHGMYVTGETAGHSRT